MKTFYQKCCVVCGGLFNTDNNRRKTCSDECKRARLTIMYARWLDTGTNRADQNELRRVAVRKLKEEEKARKDKCAARKAEREQKQKLKAEQILKGLK